MFQSFGDVSLLCTLVFFPSLRFVCDFFIYFILKFHERFFSAHVCALVCFFLFSVRFVIFRLQMFR